MAQLSNLSVPELQRLQKLARRLAHKAKFVAGSFNTGNSDRPRDWFRYCDELELRGVKPEEL